MTTITLISAFFLLYPMQGGAYPCNFGQACCYFRARPPSLRVNILPHNAGAELVLATRNAKQDLIPKPTHWLFEHPNDHGVNSSRVFEAWTDTISEECFGAKLAAQILVRNGNTGTPASMSTSLRDNLSGTAPHAPAVVTAEKALMRCDVLIQSIVDKAVAVALAASMAWPSSSPLG